ncbi:unnamed protein product [Vitrella brassicaformis CCMP3155]|uniref:Activator of Hsp90 ATPase homologue 1/2-like C-terminal domain-containing protein n=1 Tax=Vitrella brassicaformis (strain CCMP3155) TaxID=1169540 RepID=A0A0G4EZ64_VITBC|nr:unnamed protein product [Vitrella brassicaformis CCMP3155]|eukprot:CEM04602.1 unnamed protein product [Vitrella brassicaformis CCMP3155]
MVAAASKDVSIEEKFAVPPKVLYQALLSADDLTRMALGAATQMDATVGGKFSLFAGGVCGENVVLEEPSKIVQKWRFAEWADDVYSTVEIRFIEEAECVTRIELKQTNIPGEDKFGNPGAYERCLHGWKGNFFDRMEKVLGYPRERG